MTKVKIINKSNNKLPEYATTGSAGFDIRANIVEQDDDGEYSTALHPRQRKAISTGLYFELPEGTQLEIRPRSGMALNHGITVLNSPGTIDHDFRGAVQIILINHSDNIFIIKDGDRIAQGVLMKYERAEFAEFDSPGRHRETRRHRISDQGKQQPTGDCGFQ